MLDRYNAFIGDLSESLQAFKQEWAVSWPDVIDTKWVAEMVPDVTAALSVQGKLCTVRQQSHYIFTPGCCRP